MKRKLLKAIFIILYVYPIITLECSVYNGNEESCINTKDVGKYPVSVSIFGINIEWNII